MLTENGWPSCGIADCDTNPIPGTNIKIPLQRGIPNTIMKAFAADFNVHVESLAVGADEGGWTLTNSVATSNHLGGTAMDLNWNQHPMGKAYDGYTATEIAAVRDLLGFYEQCIYWGEDWTTPKDSMHFQMGYNTYTNQAKCNDFIKRKILPTGFSTYKSNTPQDPNAFPLPAGYYWGPLDGPEESISGQAGEPQGWLDGLGRWQGALGLPVTKVWDDATMKAATVMQKANGWKPNQGIKVNGGYGGVYLGEWDAVIKQGWRLPGTTPAPPTERQLLEQIAADVKEIRKQLSPEGDPAWKNKGESVRDLAYAIAAKLGA